MYSDIDLIQQKAIEIRSPKKIAANSFEWIEEFLPLDAESQKHTWDLVEAGWGQGFNFATDGCGNFCWVPVDVAKQDDAPVYFACHDPWGNEMIAESLEEFLSWPRVYAERKR